MNIFPERRTAGGTTTACRFEATPMEANGAESGSCPVITKMCEAITSRMPVGYEDETGFITGWPNPSRFSFEPAASEPVVARKLFDARRRQGRCWI